MLIRSTIVVLLSIMTTAQAFAQVTPSSSASQGVSSSEIDGGTPDYIRPESAEQRRLRLGTAEDPGLNPDPKQEFWRFGHRYVIERYDRKFAAYDAALGHVRPFAMANFAYEIYQQNEKYVWTWMPLTVEETKEQAVAAGRHTADAPAAKVNPYTDLQVGYLKKIAPEYELLEPPKSPKTIRFEPSSTGLPEGGSWRNGGALADMNGDGFVDIVAPPQRGLTMLPSIFLGDGKGNWKIWNAVWPYEFQYGTVVAADFNGDKKMDVAAAVHLAGVRVFLGDGKGNFTDASKGLPARDFPTRRIVVADVDRDGDPDLLAIYEGPSGSGTALGGSRVRAYLNENKASEWKGILAAQPEDITGGDWLATGRFNDDNIPDFVTSSNYFQATDILYRSTGKAKWAKVKSDGFLVPYLSVHTAVAAGAFSSKKRDDALIAYQRHWPTELDPSIVRKPSFGRAIGIDRISFTGPEPKRIPVVRFESEAPISGIAVADFDGDRNLDFMYSRYAPREFVLMLGDGKGGFSRATIEGMPAQPAPNYDLHVGDVNGDKRPDIMVMYESASGSRLGFQNGSIQVFLNRGPATAVAATR